MSWAHRNINLGDTAEEKRFKAERREWMNRVQWRKFKGNLHQNEWQEFRVLFDAMKQTGDETELTAWIQAYNGGSVK